MVRAVPLPARMIPLASMRLSLLELAVTLKPLVEVSMSPMVNSKAAVEVSSAISWSAILVIVGASLTGVTVKLKLKLEEVVPSLIVIVMMLVPL